jgi:uncharacterized protein YndB with AHSA1/START domain
MERRLAHPAEKVWRALTEPSELAGWFPAAVEVDLRLDGRIAFEFPGGEDDFVEDPDNTGVVRAYEPPHLLEYSWGAEVLRWELSPTGDGCLLVLTATYDDRPGSASFTSGWLLCLDALDRVLGGSAVPGDGSAVPGEDYAELHEHFVKVFGLDRGEVLEEGLEDGLKSGAVRFERQLVRPKEQVWSTLTGAAEATVGAPPPPGFVAKGIEPGPVEVVTPSVELVYPAQHGSVRWQLRDGNGGARLVVTQSGRAEPFLPAWQDLIESLAANLLDAGRS